MAPWRLHDIRRTGATGLQQLGFRLEVIEATLGHISVTGRRCWCLSAAQVRQ